MNEFDDLGPDIFAGPDDTPANAKPMGLIVPMQARVVYGPKGAVIYDELAAAEREYRARGRPPVIFEDEDEDASTPREPWRVMS